jgi:hypothetical protein
MRHGSVEIMKKRTKGEMAEYQRIRRANKGSSVSHLVTPPLSVLVVTPVTDNVTPIKSVTPSPNLVKPCNGCLERDLQIKKLMVRVAFLERSMERYADIDTRIKNPKKFGGNWL